MADLGTVVSQVTRITTAWIQDVNNFIYRNIGSSLGASLVGFIASGVGAVLRTLQDKNREFISVMDYGAVGDGVTDDSPAIQRALDAVPATGGALFFPARPYALYSDLVSLNKPNLRLVGEVRGTRAYFRNDLTAISRGVQLLGMTPGMTMLRIGRDGSSPFIGVYSHQGPEVTNICFSDGTWSAPIINGTITWAVQSGTVYRFTYAQSLQLPGARLFVPGDRVYFSDLMGIDELENLSFEVLAAGSVSTNYYFDVDVGTALPTTTGTLTRPVSLENVIDEMTMTLLQIDSYTRYRVGRCAFSLGEYAIKVVDGNTADLSWGLIEDNSLVMNKYSVFLDAGTVGAVSSIVDGGDISVPAGGVGVAVGTDSGSTFSNLIVGRMKIDIGKNTNTTGDGAIGIDMRSCSDFDVNSVRYEMLGDCVAVRVGLTGPAFGKIHGCGFQGNRNRLDPRGMQGKAILLTGAVGEANVTRICYGTNVYGNTANNMDLFCHLEGITHNNNVYGNTVVAGNGGVLIDAGSYLNNVFGNNRTRLEEMADGWIVDNGTLNNVYMNSNAAGPTHDFIPTRTPLLVEPVRTDLVAMTVYPSRGYVPDVVSFQVEADDITDGFTRADAAPPGNTDTGQTWTVETSVPSAAPNGTWRITSNALARDYQDFGGSTVTSALTISAAADFTAIVELTSTATALRSQHGVAFRLVDGQNYLYFEMQAIGDSTTWRLRKMLAGTASTLQSSTRVLEPSTTYTVKVVARLENVKCYINDEKVIDFNLSLTDQATFLTPVKVGLMSATSPLQDDGGVRWNDFQVQYTQPAFAVNVDGKPSWKLASLAQTTVGAAGAASALPATPTSYVKIQVNGVDLVVPAYLPS